MGAQDVIAAGMDGLHPVADTAVVFHRGHLVPVTPAVRNRYVRVWLEQHGHADIADILGLTGPGRPARPPVRVVRTSVPLAERQCEACGDFYRPRAPGQRACGRKCGSALARQTQLATEQWCDGEPTGAAGDRP